MQAQQELSPDKAQVLADRLQWPAAARERATELTLQPPELSEWRIFLDRLLLAGGSLGLLFGTVFFVAANWSMLGVWSKFLLTQVFWDAPCWHAKPGWTGPADSGL